MTTKRVVLGPGGASPFRVSVAGVDAAGAQFSDLIFDADQAPLRIFLNGVIAVPYINSSVDPSKTINHVVGPAGPSVPAGTSALFLVMHRAPESSGGGLLRTPLFDSFDTTLGQGGGGAMEDGFFRALSFLKSGPPGYPTGNYINYCIFKNYQ